MMTSRIFRRVFVLAFLLSPALIGCGAPGGDSSSSAVAPIGLDAEPLFIDASSEGRLMEAGGEAGSDHADDRPMSRRQRYVRVNFRPLERLAASAGVGAVAPAPGRLAMNVFEDESLMITTETVEKFADGNFAINAKIEGDADSAATLVVDKDVLVANVRRGESAESYEVRHTGQGLHLVEIREDDADEQCPSEPSPEPADDLDVGQGVDGALASPELDVLVAYTPKARSKMGGTSGIRATIQMGVADTNAALRDSGSGLRVRLVGMMEVRQNETGNWSSDLAYLRKKTDGRWNEVHAERARLGADQVTMVATYPNSGSTQGIGYIKAGASTAFAVVRATSFGSYTFSHELGHNLGLNHSDGYVNSAGRFRTIIAYGSYPRIRRYSNPSVDYKGYRTGTAAKNEASIINANSLRASSLVPKRATVGL